MQQDGLCAVLSGTSYTSGEAEPPPAVIGDPPISRLLVARLPERFLEARTCADGTGAPSSGVLRQMQLWGGVRRC